MILQNGFSALEKGVFRWFKPIDRPVGRSIYAAGVLKYAQKNCALHDPVKMQCAVDG